MPVRVRLRAITAVDNIFPLKAGDAAYGIPIPTLRHFCLYEVLYLLSPIYEVSLKKKELLYKRHCQEL